VKDCQSGYHYLSDGLGAHVRLQWDGRTDGQVRQPFFLHCQECAAIQ